MILMEETDERFYIKESTIPNSGMGVYASVPLKKGDYLEIIGVRVKPESISDHCTRYANAYKFSARPGEKKDLIIPMGYAAIINHYPPQQNCLITLNRKPPRNPAAGLLVYQFLRDIEVDEELFADYGENWGVTLQWAEERTAASKELKNDWNEFLKFDLYNLGGLL